MTDTPKPPTTLAYENAARQIHPSAQNFQAVSASGLRSKIVGWVFEVEAKDSSFERYAWIDIDHTVSTDPRSLGSDAARGLRAYRKALSQGVLNLKASTTGDATATGGGTAVTGIQVTVP